MGAYYNENDKFAAAWLRELIKEGLIADGEVDERSITEVRPEDVRGFTQCHFFAGIGTWSYALRNAGWPDDTAVWTGSCPCQSFSASGKREGFSDKRHLWPAWQRLILECRPDTVFGEQVAGKDGLAWLDVVSSDLEGAGYAVGACGTAACGFGAPHIRQRLYFVAQSANARPSSQHTYGQSRTAEANSISTPGATSLMADAQRPGLGRRRSGQEGYEPGTLERSAGLCQTNGFWAGAEWIWCRDRKYRPVEPGTFPLARGAPARVVRLRGYGNALCAPQAQAFIEAYMELTQQPAEHPEKETAPHNP